MRRQLNNFRLTRLPGTTPSIGRCFTIGLNLRIVGIIKGGIDIIPYHMTEHRRLNFFWKCAHAQLNINAIMRQTWENVRSFLCNDIDKNQVVSTYGMRINRNIR